MKTKVLAAFIALLLLGGIGSLAWFETQEIQQKGLERYEYQGHVTALQSSGAVTIIYLNSDFQQLYVNGTVQLVMGKEYRIVVDGNRNLINAVIVGE